MQINACSRALDIEYAIRDVIIPARKFEERGEEVLKLNIGDPLKFDFDTPTVMKEGFKKAIDSGKNFYGSSEGITELRKEISSREKRKNDVEVDPGDVLVTTGISEGLNMLLGSLLEEGDEILIPGPSYPPYIAFANFYNALPVTYETVEEKGWQPSIEDMEKKITSNTKGIVVINPNNPTGALYSENILEKIVLLARRKGLPIISDEIYDQLTYERTHVGIASLAESENVPTIILNGFSKVYLATGWRLGYMYFVNKGGYLSEVIEGVNNMARIRLCPSTPAQYGALEGIKSEMEHLNDLVNKLRERRDYFWERVNNIPGLSAEKPEGAFYIFPKIQKSLWKDDKEFVLDLLKQQKLLFVHGSGFDPKYGSGHFRSVFLAPIDVLGEGLDKLENYIKKMN